VRCVCVCVCVCVYVCVRACVCKRLKLVVCAWGSGKEPYFFSGLVYVIVLANYGACSLNCQVSFEKESRRYRAFPYKTHCSTLQHTVTLQHTATHCNTPPMVKLNKYCSVQAWGLACRKRMLPDTCNTLQHTCNTRQLTATHCNTLQHTATHGNTRQHTATHCNTLQHTATHCNTL